MNDLLNKTIGNLKVIKHCQETELEITFDYWICECIQCGRKTEVLDRDLRSNNYPICNCYMNTKLYNVWRSMHQRCFNMNNRDYKYYGERGIIVCNEWGIAEIFYRWAIENGYKEGLTIDRIDVNGNYEPSNCRWISRSEQARNKTNNVMITYEGETHCLNEWSRIKKISKDVLRYRLKRLKEQNTMDFDYLFRVVKRA